SIIKDEAALNGTAYHFVRNSDELSWTLEDTAEGSYQIRATARGELYEGAPKLEISAGTQRITKEINSTTYITVDYGSFNLKQGDKVTVRFVNDKYDGSRDKDRNVVLSHLDIVGSTTPTEPEPTDPEPTEPEPTEPEPTEPEPTEPEPTEPTPVEPAPTDPAPPVTGTLIDVLDAETGDFSQWRNPDGGGSGNHSIVTSPVAQGTKAFKWVHKDGRTESASAYYSLNQDLWFSWKLWVPSDFNDAFDGKTSQGLSVSQLHGFSSQCSDNEPIGMLRVADGQFFWWLKYMGTVEGIHDDLGSVPKEQWINLLVNAKFTSGSDGYFRFWINGEQKLDLKGSTWTCSANGPYFKMGTYAHGYSDGDYILGDDIRVGTTREIVEQ
ncbi:MAG: heparin lyase I family protein, partial [Trueperaceae bacterium]